MATALVRSFFFLRQNDPRIGSYFLFFVPSDAAAAEGVSSTNDAAKQTPPEPNKRRNERKQTGPSRRILGDVVFRFFFHFAAQRKIADSTAPIESSFLALSEKVIFSSLFFQIYKKKTKLDGLRPRLAPASIAWRGARRRGAENFHCR